jgi:hypothetical protein
VTKELPWRTNNIKMPGRSGIAAPRVNKTQRRAQWLRTKSIHLHHLGVINQTRRHAERTSSYVCTCGREMSMHTPREYKYMNVYMVVGKSLSCNKSVLSLSLAERATAAIDPAALVPLKCKHSRPWTYTLTRSGSTPRRASANSHTFADSLPNSSLCPVYVYFFLLFAFLIENPIVCRSL